MDILNVDTLLFMIPVAAVVALVFALYFYRDIFSKDTGTPEMQKISNAIRDGAMAYLARQYKTIGIISVIVAVILGVAGAFGAFDVHDVSGISAKWTIAIAFLIGAGFSILSGFIGMYISVNANIRTASAARRSLGEAFRCSFRGGAVSGIAVAALSLLGVFTLFAVYDAAFGDVRLTLQTIIGYAFGASLAALFAQLGGGIYTKAADVGADLVGKVEAGIPEDDPRNPAVIADLVGDNVGDCAGRGADIFESTAAEIIGAMVIGFAVFWILFTNGSFTNMDAWYLWPLVMIAFGLIASLVGIFVVRMKDESSDLYKTLNLGYYVTAILIVAFLGFTTWWMLGDQWYYFFGCGIIGILLGIAIIYITQYYTAGAWRPVKEIAKASETGPATNAITGLSIGMETTVLPILSIVVAIISTFTLGWFAGGAMGLGPDDQFVFGIYGTAVGTIAMLASSAFILAEDTFGPITDNAGGIAEMSGQPKEVRDRTDRLDSAGNTTKALTKGYAMGSAALAAFLLFAAYFEIVADARKESLIEAFNVNLGNPLIFAGALIGGMLVFFFAALAIRAVGTAAGSMIENVRTQFREKPGIMNGTEEPDYAQCVDIATRGALKAMVLPALLPIVIPVSFGLLYRFGPAQFQAAAPAAVGALIMVGTIVGILMANFLNNGGGAWDNAKKYIEEGNHGGKGSRAHAAAVVGDTIGDPFKDTAGPSIHVLVKLLATICLVTAVLFIA